ncbi:hypothetical protein AVEN_187574-1 [Araneus ventricosus]|uniref:Uncharacterized protein n=1 Tax=Araneus ventricosus TaxID=182803 RepID=A0A4Y2NQT1_ARAVE|nr:hypothetical protein AVEN_261483-1 [Araneus ventricosus]GBN41183.1 hypothetical protein AVEN_187574-1 [Araneus ventricosus]
MWCGSLERECHVKCHPRSSKLQGPSQNSLLRVASKRDVSLLATAHSNAFTLKNLTAAAVGKWSIHTITPPAVHLPLLFTSSNPPRTSKVSDMIKL